MIDYISATTTFDCKGTIFFQNMTLKGIFTSGWEFYSVDGCEQLTVRLHRQYGILQLKGSIPYYWQGNNFTFSRTDFGNAINYLCDLLNINLWQAQLNAFEYGVIMEVQMRPREYIKHHAATNGLLLNERERDKDNYRNWEDKNVKLKMYDAGRNIKMKQGENRKEIIRNAGWNDDGEYLKWEAHYLKPEYLNRGVALHLYDLMNDDWNNTFKEDLYLQYKRLIPMKNLTAPRSKKDLSTIDIMIHAFAEQGINDGLTLDDVKKMLYARVNAEPLLSKSDKDLRKRSIKKSLDKIMVSPQSKWDLSKQIQDTLESC